MSAIIVSAILVVRNEEKYLPRCVDSILATDFSRDQYELLIIDGRSTDRSRAIAAERAAAYSNVRLLDNPELIFSTGANLGIRQARGEYIVIMGAHCEYPRDYISASLAELEATGADAVGGTLITRPGANTIMAQAIALATQHPFGVGNSGFRIGRGGRFANTVPYGVYRRRVFERAGLFREDLVRNQDFEFNARVRAAGGRLYLSSKIQVTYYNVPTFARFLRQAYGKGIWVARGWLCSPATFCLRHAAPAIFVLALLFVGLASAISHIAAVVGTSVIALYLVLAISSALQLAISNGWRVVVVLPVLFPAYHVAYGIATLITLPAAYFSSAPEVTRLETVNQGRSADSREAD